MRMDYQAEKAAVLAAHPQADAYHNRRDDRYEVRTGPRGEVIGKGFLVGSAWKDAAAKLAARV